MRTNIKKRENCTDSKQPAVWAKAWFKKWKILFDRIVCLCFCFFNKYDHFIGLSGNLHKFRLLWNFDQRISKWKIIAAIQLDCILNRVRDPGCPVVSLCLLNPQPSCLHWIVVGQTQSPPGKQIIFTTMLIGGWCNPRRFWTPLRWLQGCFTSKEILLHFSNDL